MAIRSNAGTGVTVALVVFILISIFLLVTTILFYSGKNAEMDKAKDMAVQLDQFAKPSERSGDSFNTVQDAAKKERKSVLGYVTEQNNAMKSWISGNQNDSLEAMKRRFNATDQNLSLLNTVNGLQRQVADTNKELDSIKNQLSALQEERDTLTAEIEAASRSRDTLLAAESKQIEQYRTATDEHLKEIADVREQLETATDKMRDRYSDQIKELETEVDGLSQEKVILKGRVEDLEQRINKTRIKPHDPATLVDGSIIDIAGSNDQVYINRGRQDQIVLGMTFEIYGDAAQIRPTDDGEFPEGKGSLQVIKVGENTSTAKITRSTLGQPIVRDDVIVNAIYDPEYQFKFLVHGQFDIDQDGQPTEEEAAYLRSQIENWGGIVIQSDTLPGDLDFLVLGVTPLEPPVPPKDASTLQMQDYRRKKTTQQMYQELYRQARNAQLPILNATRLHILTGGGGI
jgi:archaellum component FlaC